MSGTDGARPNRPTGESDALGDHEYFRAIEEVFVELRGAPLLLSPKDWHTARRWHQEGIPLDLVLRTLEEVFERRRERGDEDAVSSLRYCDRPVRAAWKERRELTAVATRPGEEIAAEDRTAPSVSERLEALAAALPEDLPEREALAERLRALGRTGAGGRGEEREERRVEEDLSVLDGEVMEGLIAGLGAERRAEIEEETGRSLGALAERLPRQELDRARQRLMAQKVRRRYGLPTLSLFAPEAEPGADPETGTERE